jgi:iron complex transport system substrate-binding protein
LASLSLISLASAGLRIASTDLCADEYLLMFADAGQIASVSHLSKDPAESPLAARARTVAGNNGSLESLAGRDVDVILTSRPMSSMQRRMAARMGMRIVHLPIVMDPDDVAANVRRVRQFAPLNGKANAWLARYRRAAKAMPSEKRPHLWLSIAGSDPGSATRAWLALAGIEIAHPSAGTGRIEQVATSPYPLIVSEYRQRQYSRNAEWLGHPLVKARLQGSIRVDGRRFTCAGPLMLDQIERLKS